MNRLEKTLLCISPKPPIAVFPPPLPRPEKVLTFREALLTPRKTIRAEKALGKILIDAHVSCPPCIPIIASGERIDEDAIRCFRYYHVAQCDVAARP